MPFFFKHINAKLKMPVTWKCFDGIQREEISDVRTWASQGFFPGRGH